MKIRSPLTDSDDVMLIKVLQSEQLIHDWKRDFQIDVAEELRGHEKIYLYQCNQSGLRFFAPVDIAGSGALYEQLKKHDSLYMIDRWEHKIALENLHDCKKVLEIGCAYGAFVKSGIEANLDITGIELNESAVKFSQSQGLPVERVDLQKIAELYPASLDAVCSFQVLEHVSDPKNFVNYATQLLKPNGKLIFCVPNSESFLKYEYNLLDMPPHHLTQWSDSSFKYLETIFPLRVEKILVEPLATYHVSAYLKSYKAYFSTISPATKLFLNRYTIAFLKKILNTGVRKFLTGQGLYVQFRKINEMP